MRRTLSFSVEGAMLAATLDTPDDNDATTAILIVTGGNEVRAGAHRGQAELAARLAKAGIASLRFDRRGVGDSEGDNAGFEGSRDDIAGALAALRAQCPSVTRVVGWGNCDAASALLLHQPLNIDALVLGNPWVIEGADEDALAEADDDTAPDATPLPSPAAIRARYIARLKHPAEWLRLLRGGVDLRKLVRGLKAASARPPSAPVDAGSLPARVLTALERVEQPTTILIAQGDRTAQAFVEHWDAGNAQAVRQRPTITVLRRNTPSHSFAGADGDWLFETLVQVARQPV